MPQYIIRPKVGIIIVCPIALGLDNFQNKKRLPPEDQVVNTSYAYDGHTGKNDKYHPKARALELVCKIIVHTRRNGIVSFAQILEK
jgi:hypothetical protein